jgi:hypothetical protein
MPGNLYSWIQDALTVGGRVVIKDDASDVELQAVKIIVAEFDGHDLACAQRQRARRGLRQHYKFTVRGA